MQKPTTRINVYIKVFKVCRCLLSNSSIGILQGRLLSMLLLSRAIEHYPNISARPWLRSYILRTYTIYGLMVIPFSTFPLVVNSTRKHKVSWSEKFKRYIYFRCLIIFVGMAIHEQFFLKNFLQRNKVKRKFSRLRY